MDYYKKVLVLKQTEYGVFDKCRPLGGIVRVECENGICEIHLSFINFSPTFDGVYKGFFSYDNGKIFCIDLGSNPTFLHTIIPNFSTSHPLSFGVVLIKNDIPLTLAFASEQNAPNAIKDFNRAVIEKVVEEKKQTASTKKVCSTTLLTEEQSTSYDDEAVATVNYYDFDTDINCKLEKIKECDNVVSRMENELPYNRSKEKTEKIQTDNSCSQNEKNGGSFAKYSQKNPFYSTVRSELNEIFRKFPEEKELTGALPNSKWAKITYAENKFYVVGLIKENSQPKYICYGVPATYSSAPPKDLAGKSTFIPLSVFNVHGDGYWMMFQDAITGERLDMN